MTHAAVPKSFSRVLLAGAVCLLFGIAVPMVFAQSRGGGGSHGGGASHASAASGGGSFGSGHVNGGHATAGASGISAGAGRASAGGGFASSAAHASDSSARLSNEGNRSARFYGALGTSGGSVGSSARVGAAQNATTSARFFGATSAGSSEIGGTGAIRGEDAGESPAGRGFTRSVFAPPTGQAASQQIASGRTLPSSRYVSGGNAEEPSIETLGRGRAQVIVNSRAPVRYELVGGEWIVSGGNAQQKAKEVASGPSALRPSEWLVASEPQQQRPAYTPPPAPRPMPVPQAPRPIMTPPSAIPPRPVTPMQMPPRPIGQPIRQNPVRPIGTPASPPIAQVPGQPAPRFPIARPPMNPGQPVGRPIAPVTQPIVRVPGQPEMHFPMVRPPLGRMPGTPAFHPPIAPPAKSPLFHPVVTPPGKMPIRRIGGPVTRGPLEFAGGAPPLRRIFDGVPNGAPFIVATPQPPRFNAHPCFDTIGHCGFGFGFDGDFDFDDGFFFGFPFGSPFFFGPFGFPAFGFGGFGPNCFFNGIVEPCAFTPLGFAQFQAFGPNGWGWSGLGFGNGWFYSPPQEPPPPPWNSTETNPGLNLQYFTNEWYVPYSEPETTPQTGAASNGNEPGAEQNQNVVTEIVTTDGIVFGVTSYWMEDNQLCYVTTYNIKNCIPMSRVDLQKTVDMNYKRGVKFTLTPKPAEKPQPPDSQKPQLPDAKPDGNGGQ